MPLLQKHQWDKFHLGDWTPSLSSPRSDSALREHQGQVSPRRHYGQPQQAGGGQAQRRSGHQHGLQGAKESDQCQQRQHLPGPDCPADRGMRQVLRSAVLIRGNSIYY